MDCDQAQLLLSARLDGEIAPEDGALLSAHLQDCTACRTTAQALEQQDADLRRAFAPRREAAAAVTERVLAKLPATLPRRRLPPWLPMLLSAAAGFLVAVGIFRPWERPAEVATAPPTQREVNPPPAPELLQLAVASGPVEAQPPGQDAWQPVKVGGTVEAGCTVRTPPEVRCEIRCPDQSAVKLNGDTEVQFKSGRQLALARGQILANVEKHEVPFEVAVGEATVTALGTRFDILLKPAETLLTVLEGRTHVRGPGTPALVETGERARIVNGEVADKQRAWDLVQATSWVNEILRLKGRDDPELAKRVDELLADIGRSKMDFLSEEEIRALGDHCVLPLTRYVQSDKSRSGDQRSRRAVAAHILGDLAQPWSIPDLIKLLEDDDPEVRYHAAKALTRLTSKDFRCPPDAWRTRPPAALKENVKEWQAWWDENKQRFPKGP